MKWNRSLGKSKQELGIVTPKMPTNIRKDETTARVLIYTFMLRRWDHLSETLKKQIVFVQMSREDKLQTRLMSDHAKSIYNYA